MATPYFPRDPIKLDYIYFHVGRFVVLFADVEDAVTHCNKTFLDVLGSNQEWPRNTKRRIAVFRECLPHLPISDRQRQIGSGLIDRFETVNDHRQWIVHGITWDESYEKRNPILSLMKVALSGDYLEFRDYHLADIEEHADECLKLSSEFWDWLVEDIGWVREPEKDEPDRSGV